MPKRRHKKTVTVVNRKGGVGKSFIADEIAWALERDGVACAFWDFDGQGGTGHETSDAEEREAAEVYVVDTPGAITRQMRDLLKQTDVAVVPVTPVGSDVSATEYTMDVVESACPKAAKIVGDERLDAVPHGTGVRGVRGRVALSRLGGALRAARRGGEAGARRREERLRRRPALQGRKGHLGALRARRGAGERL